MFFEQQICGVFDLLDFLDNITLYDIYACVVPAFARKYGWNDVYRSMYRQDIRWWEYVIQWFFMFMTTLLTLNLTYTSFIMSYVGMCVIFIFWALRERLSHKKYKAPLVRKKGFVVIIVLGWVGLSFAYALLMIPIYVMIQARALGEL